MTNSWMNEDGEPIMDGAAWRFEQQLDMESAQERFFDDFYDNEPSAEYEECVACGGDIDPDDDKCFDCGWDANEVPEGPGDGGRVEAEDSYLDSYMESRMMGEL